MSATGKPTTQVKKMGKELDHFTKEDIPVNGQEAQENGLNGTHHQEMQIKTTGDPTLYALSWLLLKKPTDRQ